MQERFISRRPLRGLLVSIALSAFVACGDSDVEKEIVVPTALSQSLEVQEGSSLRITLDAVGGEPSFVVAEGPSHGTLTGTPPELTYVPDTHYLGRDSFTFTASEGGESATVFIDVRHTPFFVISRGTQELASKLFRVERGAAALVGETGHALITLKVDPTDGTLYAITRETDFEDTCDNCLVTLDKATGAATIVGELGLNGAVPSIAFTSDGTLFGWTEDGDDAIRIDKESGVATVLGESEINSYGHGMWVDAEDTLWFINGDGYVYIIDPESGEATEMHTGESLAESAGIDYSGDFMIRGDLNPATGAYWGVSPGYGSTVASGVIRFVIEADQVEYVGSVSAESVPAAHNLAFER